jgi:hypothetical protein
MLGRLALTGSLLIRLRLSWLRLDGLMLDRLTLIRLMLGWLLLSRSMLNGLPLIRLRMMYRVRLTCRTLTINWLLGVRHSRPPGQENKT